MEPMEILDGEGESLHLDSKYLNLPLDALRRSSRTKIALYLDEPSEIIDEDSGLVRDWNGLAELVGFSSLEMRKFGRQKSPTQELLLDWESRSDLQPSLGNLWKYLIELGRLDVVQDSKRIVVKDAENYIQTRERLQNDYLPIQDAAISQSTAPDHYVDETAMLVTGDVDGSTTLFDAFICYNVDSQNKDILFVKEMIKKLEKQYDLKLCVPGRDILPGGCRYVVEAKLIEQRCRRMIIVLSHDYLHSSACDFQVKFAHALAPGARSKKLIPVLIEPGVPIPQILRHVTLCDYTKNDLMEWFWDRLAKSVKAPLDPDQYRKRTTNTNSSSPMSSSSSTSLPTGQSPQSSSSLSSVGSFHFDNKSLKSVEVEFEHIEDIPESILSNDSGIQSPGPSSLQSQSSISSAGSESSCESRFSNQYTPFPSQNHGKKKDSSKTFIGHMKKVFGTKKNNNTSSYA